MTIRRILTEIVNEVKNDMYHQKVRYDDYDVETLIKDITSVNNERFLVESEWDIDGVETVENAGDIDIDVKGYIVYYFINHDAYFYLERMKDKDSVTEFLLDIWDNDFYQDIIVLLDGNVKKYIINKKGDKKTVTWVD